jgi:hypothetical protein
VRAGEAIPPLRRRYSQRMQALAARYIWWEPPARALRRPLRVVAQVLNLGTAADCAALEEEMGTQTERTAVEKAEPGWFNERSWTYWHYRLGITPWGDEPPSLPVRHIP